MIYSSVHYREVEERGRKNAEEYKRMGAERWMPWGNSQDAYTRHAESWWALFAGWESWFEWGDEII